MTIPSFDGYQFQVLDQTEVNAFKTLERNDPFRRLLPQAIDIAIAGALPQNVELKYVDLTISSADIQQLNTTPIVLIPAPGVGKFLQVLSYAYINGSGTTSYSNSTLYLQYMNNTVVTASSALGGNPNDVMVGNVTNLEVVPTNSAIYVFAPVGNPSGGDFSLEIKMLYQIFSF